VSGIVCKKYENVQTLWLIYKNLVLVVPLKPLIFPKGLFWVSLSNDFGSSLMW